MTSSKEPVLFAGCLQATSTDTRQGWPSLVLLGICDDSQSSFRPGAAKAPEVIRRAYDGNCYNSASESGVDLAAAVDDWGDIFPGATWADSSKRYRGVAQRAFECGSIPFFMGGDHAVTIALVEAAKVLGEPVHILQVDAHGDLYPTYEGNPHSHACVACRLLEMKHVDGITQLGVRTLNQAQIEQSRMAGGRLRTQKAWEWESGLPPLEHISRTQPLYVTLDVDAFDPAFAPGVSHPVPGGLTPRQVLNLLRMLPGRLIGMDVVEVNPTCDNGNRTAILAARLLHEAMATAVLQSGASGEI